MPRAQEIEVAKGARIEVFAEADFAARLQPDGVLHEVVESSVYKVADGATWISVSHETTGMPADEKISVLKVKVLISYDGGKEWHPLFSFTSRGGTPNWPEGSGFSGTRTTVGHAIHHPRIPGRLVKVEYIPLVPLRADLDLRVD